MNNQHHRQLNTAQPIGLIGSLFLIFGSLTPILSTPAIEFNLWKHPQHYGEIMVIMAIIGIVFTLFQNFKLLWIPTLGSIFITGYTFWGYYSKLDELNGLTEQLKVNSRMFNFEYGWCLLIIGSLLLLITIAISDQQQKI